jgi:hypothetical protein
MLLYMLLEKEFLLTMQGQLRRDRLSYLTTGSQEWQTNGVCICCLISRLMRTLSFSSMSMTTIQEYFGFGLSSQLVVSPAYLPLYARIVDKGTGT